MGGYGTGSSLFRAAACSDCTVYITILNFFFRGRGAPARAASAVCLYERIHWSFCIIKQYLSPGRTARTSGTPWFDDLNSREYLLRLSSMCSGRRSRAGLRRRVRERNGERDRTENGTDGKEAEHQRTYLARVYMVARVGTYSWYMVARTPSHRPFALHVNIRHAFSPRSHTPPYADI